MKLLKIVFAIVFFCLLGGVNSELIAQNTFEVGVYSLENTNQSIKSSNGTFTFEISAKKMSIMDNSKQAEIWSVDYTDTPACSFAITKEGCFDIISCGAGNDGFSWKSGLTGFSRTSSMSLTMQDDGNLVVYCLRNPRMGIRAAWATGTCGGVLNGCGAVGKR